MFVIESIRVARSSESICVYMVTFIVEFDHSSRATRLFDEYPSGCDEVWEWKPVFPRKIPPYRGIKMSLDDLRLRNRSIDRFRFQFIALDNVGSFSFYGANSCLFRSHSFHFVTLSPRLIGGEIVTLRHSPLP